MRSWSTSPALHRSACFFPAAPIRIRPSPCVFPGRQQQWSNVGCAEVGILSTPCNRRAPDPTHSVPENPTLSHPGNPRLPRAGKSGTWLPPSDRCLGRKMSTAVPGKEESLADAAAATEAPVEDVIVQYVVIRKDLAGGLNWPLGSVISQGCHAAVAAIWLHRDDPVTLKYCSPENLDNMHKTFGQLTLEAKGEPQLRTLAQTLETGGISHKLWIEQPENYATCLATKPYYKNEVSSYFKKLKLCK